MFNGGSWTRPFSSLPCAEHLFAISEIFTALARGWMPQSRFYQHERLISSSDPNISIWTNELPVAVGLQLCGWICCKRCNCRVLADKFPCHSMWKPWGISPIGNDIALDTERERERRERERDLQLFTWVGARESGVHCSAFTSFISTLAWTLLKETELYPLKVWSSKYWVLQNFETMRKVTQSRVCASSRERGCRPWHEIGRHNEWE